MSLPQEKTPYQDNGTPPYQGTTFMAAEVMITQMVGRTWGGVDHHGHPTGSNCCRFGEGGIPGSRPDLVPDSPSTSPLPESPESAPEITANMTHKRLEDGSADKTNAKHGLSEELAVPCPNGCKAYDQPRMYSRKFNPATSRGTTNTATQWGSGESRTGLVLIAEDKGIDALVAKHIQKQEVTENPRTSAGFHVYQ
ncbi:hypothetical protein JB92DRAFT_2826783 [Gautieria morchelliformis]|nr:hypothetical protein JB92DRAFT_2826783 [Gautieria morchelliformis]